MRVHIDTDRATLELADDAEPRTLPLHSVEAFEVLSRLWLRSSWALRYSYGFSWMGRPVIQLPEDLVRLQETIVGVRPDVIVETGVAHGGSAVFFASLCKALSHGRVIAVDIEIRPGSRAAIEANELASWITLVEGSSVDPEVVARVRSLVRPEERALVVLDSDHSKAHVQSELEAYAPLVGLNSYLIVMDGIMEDLAGLPGSRPDWIWNNPRQAAREFARAHPEFEIEEPRFGFDETRVRTRITHAPDGFLRRVARSTPR